MRCLLAVLLLLACSGDDDGPGGDGAPTGGADAMVGCGAVGQTCSDGTCPADYRCFNGTGGAFCSPERPMCGGIAGAQCMDDAQVCEYLPGASYGPCLTEEEKDCVCTANPAALQGCASMAGKPSR